MLKAPKWILFSVAAASIFTLIVLINNLLPLIALSLLLAFVWRQANQISFPKNDQLSS